MVTIYSIKLNTVHGTALKMIVVMIYVQKLVMLASKIGITETWKNITRIKFSNIGT